jgi:CDP-diacylglycerol--glycerol-3-phosphate 3-phosphatidyltransferase
LSDTILYAPFAFIAGVNPILIGAIVTLAIISEMTGVVGIQIGASRRYDGPMGKSDRAFCFGLLALLLGLGVKDGLWVHLYLGIMTALLILTIFNRARKALKEVA